MADKHTQMQHEAFNRLTPYMMAWVLMRTLATYRGRAWRTFEETGKGTAAHAARVWLQYDMAYALVRKVTRLLAPFASPDDPDASIIVKSELDENRIQLEGKRGE